jgi:hypothetical protein
MTKENVKEISETSWQTQSKAAESMYLASISSKVA